MHPRFSVRVGTRKPDDRPVVVITGASSGIGAASALLLAKCGANLVLAARGEAALADIASRCRAEGGDAVHVTTDVAEPEGPEELARRAQAEYGRIDGWVNNASVTIFGKLLHLDAEDIQRTIDVNVFGYLNCVRAAAPRIRASGGGVIVFVNSVLSEVYVPSQGAYSMTKHAQTAMADILRHELSREPGPAIRLCNVLLSSVDTPLYSNAGRRMSKLPRPLPPMNSPTHIARKIVKLLKRPKQRSCAGIGASTVMWGHRLLPTLTDPLLVWLTRRAGYVRGLKALPTDGNLYTSVAGEHSHIDGGWRNHDTSITTPGSAVKEIPPWQR